MFCGIEYAFASLDQLSWLCCSLPVLSPSFLCTCSLSEYGKLKSLWFGVSTTYQQQNHQCVINIILILNPNHITVPAKKKTNSSPKKKKKQPISGQQVCLTKFYTGIVWINNSWEVLQVLKGLYFIYASYILGDFLLMGRFSTIWLNFKHAYWPLESSYLTLRL